jgi:hypothetical protein
MGIAAGEHVIVLRAATQSGFAKHYVCIVQSKESSIGNDMQ